MNEWITILIFGVVFTVFIVYWVRIKPQRDDKNWVLWCPYKTIVGGGICLDVSKENCENCIHSQRRHLFEERKN